MEVFDIIMRPMYLSIFACWFSIAILSLAACPARERLLALASSVPLPVRILGIRKDIGNILKELLKETLVKMDKTPEGKAVFSTSGAIRFIEKEKSGFKPVFEMLNSPGLQLETFALEAIAKETNPDARITKAKQ